MWKVEKERASLTEDETEASTDSVQAPADAAGSILSQLQEHKYEKGQLVSQLVGALSPVNHRGLHQGYEKGKCASANNQNIWLVSLTSSLCLQ